ncbi:thiol reductant ABC exporter subunit CydD [Brevibacillus daliensis]|uniref:thiol reductant ABC exporter subunit CydD n=1 Tax=Brevibacillus daliensis TaxID=2892995 RepID=UPI001E35F706|nr:thiol reductant ABC exporter subunit CydD [Brevibacillus daliensis]
MSKSLLGYKGSKPVLASVAVLTLIQTISIILQAKWLAESISALFAGHSLEQITTPVILFLFAFLIRILSGLFQQKIAYRFAETTSAAIRGQLMEQLFNLGPRFARIEGTGNLVTLVREGIGQFRTYLEIIIPRMIATGITPWLVLLFIFTQDVLSGLILLITMPILIAFMILIGYAARKQTEKQWHSYRILSNHFVDSLRGLETLKVLGRSKSHVKTIEDVSDRYRRATMKTLRVAFLSSFALDFFTMLSVASVAVSLGLRLIEGDMTLLTGLTVLILAPEYFLPIRMVGADYHATLNGKEAGAAIDKIIGTKPDQDNCSELSESYSWTGNSELMIQKLRVQHDQASKASLDQINLCLTGNKKVGIVGESGAGKSTLIDVLAGFLRPVDGEFILEGHMLNSLTCETWQKQTTYIPQHPYIFAGSLAENIRFYTPGASDEDVENAVEAAGLSPLVAKLPNGLHERIGNGGRPLSGGQEQRVALARAFLSNRPIILLDEPTAHLDIETEYELKKTMLPLFEGKLVCLATHRLHWMLEMDVIVVLDQGKVVEVGTHQELVAKQGFYYELLATQQEVL